MRLLPHEAEAIRTGVREVFSPGAAVRLFGSRVRDDLRGGDIDLFVEVDPGQATIANEQRLRDRVAPAVRDLRLDVILQRWSRSSGVKICGDSRDVRSPS